MDRPVTPISGSNNRFVVPKVVLDVTQRMLRGRGELGLEAVVLWLGRTVDTEKCRVLTAVMPGQIAYRGDAGCAVEVPRDALSQLISSLLSDPHDSVQIV